MQRDVQLHHLLVRTNLCMVICTVLADLREATQVAQCTRIARRRRNEEVEGGGGQVGLALLAGQRA